MAMKAAQLLHHKLTAAGSKLADPASLPIPEEDYKLCLSQCYQWFGHIYMANDNKTTAVSYYKTGVSYY
jgi:hypothetical protein